MVTVEDYYFIPTSTLGCIFGDQNSLSVKFINITKIQCECPPNTDLVDFSITIDGATLIKATEQFRYYPKPVISNIEPITGSEIQAYNVTITFSEETIGSSDSLSCRIGNLKSDAVYIDHSNMICEMPSYKTLSYINSGLSRSLSIYISLNGQQFSDTGFMFTYLPSYFDSIQSFTASNFHGPVTGNTEVIITTLKSLSNINPKCRFRDTIVEAYDITETTFACKSPSFSDDVKVKLSISLNGLDFSTFGREFVYDNNVTFTSISPNHGTSSGGTDIYISGTEFKPYTNIMCKLGTLIVAADYISDESILCTSLAHTKETINLKVTFNGQDYYDVFDYTYRDPEIITSISPNIGPTSGGTRILVTSNLFSTSTAYCRFGNTYKTDVYLKDGNNHCNLPPLSVISTDTFELYISSNDHDYESSHTFTYYPEIALTSITPRFISNENKSRSFTILGNNFLDTGTVKVKVLSNLYPASYISKTEIRFTATDGITAGKQAVYVSLNDQNYSLSSLYIDVYISPSIISMTPSFGFVSGGITLSIYGKNYVFSEEIDCHFGSDNTVAKYVSENEVVCANPAKNESGDVEVSVSFNGKLDFTNKIVFSYIPTPVLISITPSSAYNRESPLASIKLQSNALPKLIKIGQISITEFEYLTSTDVFFKIPIHPTGIFAVSVTFNYIEIISTLSFTFLGECEEGYFCPKVSPFSKIMCPKGSYCPSNDLMSPIPCAPGSYSDTIGSKACKSCDVSYYCPNAGLMAPISCLDGYLCPSKGLSTIASLTSCTPGYGCLKNLMIACVEGSWCGPRSVYSNICIA